jgi:hypothetical protein
LIVRFTAALPSSSVSANRQTRDSSIDAAARTDGSAAAKAPRMGSLIALYGIENTCKLIAEALGQH